MSTELEISRRRLLRNHDTFIQWVQQILNIAAVATTLVALTQTEDLEFSVPYRSLVVFTVLLMVAVYSAMGVYRRFENIAGAIRHLCRAWGVVIIILGLLSYVTGASEMFSKHVIVNWGVLSILVQIIVYLVTYKIHEWWSVSVRKKIPTLVIGDGAIAERLADKLDRNVWLPDTVVGVVNESGDAKQWQKTRFNLLGRLEDIAGIVAQHSVKRIYVALPFSDTVKLREIQEKLSEINVDLIWAPDIFALNLLNHSVREVSGVPLINLNETPLLAGGPAFLKYTLDKVVSVIALIMLSPLLLTIALLIKLGSSGPIIFRQIRDGWDGTQFYVYKFRSMYVHQEQGIVKQATKDDKRITPIGRFIRKTSIDELPQLFNVLEGSMSLVGPRPHAVSHNKFYSSKVKRYLARHRIKPGMTGLAQINGYRGETNTVEAMEKRVEYDLEYIKNWTFSLDLWILIKTPFSLFSKNAY